MKTNLIAAVLVVGTTFGMVLAQDSTPPAPPAPPEAAPCAPNEPVPPVAEKIVKTVSYDGHHASAGIWGDWVANNAASKLFNSEHEDGMFADITFTFSKDEAATKRILEQMPKLHEKTASRDSEKAGPMKHAMAEVYATGTMKMTEPDRTREAAFAMVVYRGEPMLLMLEGTKEEDFDWETIHYNFINDPNGDLDTLFLSGDMADEPYMAFKRKK